jgi:hypothetical protein
MFRGYSVDKLWLALQTCIENPNNKNKKTHFTKAEHKTLKGVDSPEQSNASEHAIPRDCDICSKLSLHNTANIKSVCLRVGGQPVWKFVNSDALDNLDVVFDGKMHAETIFPFILTQYYCWVIECFPKQSNLIVSYNATWLHRDFLFTIKDFDWYLDYDNSYVLGFGNGVSRLVQLQVNGEMLNCLYELDKFPKGLSLLIAIYSSEYWPFFKNERSLGVFQNICNWFETIEACPTANIKNLIQVELY